MRTNLTKYEVWHGEWSLATDSCAHWLGGFNDGKANYGKNCTKVECPKPYLNNSFPNTINTTLEGKHGPFTLSKEM
jgi:hypothetical protein